MGQFRQPRSAPRPARGHHAGRAGRAGNCCSPRCATPCGPAGWRLGPCCHRRAAWPPTWDWPATPSPRRTPNWSPRAGWRLGRARAPGCVNIRRSRAARPAARRARGAGPQPDARLTGRLGVPPQRMGGLHPPRAVHRADRGAAHGRCARPARTARGARRVPGPGARRAHVGGVDRRLRGRPPCASNCWPGCSAVQARSPSRPTGSSSSATRSRRWTCRRCRSASTSAARWSTTSTGWSRLRCC